MAALRVAVVAALRAAAVVAALRAAAAQRVTLSALPRSKAAPCALA